ncbi:hypothetical protein [Nostoc sp. PCC 7107]|uniref:hypothetical protein n=1 Tax=Nostoc sp. PCC 7107 TaxID=317936 RepID=UPI00029EF8FA|nr:hypothetical protein [Nostoc sp. PCC 7107]AFY41602.1 hypothetical protein Nos7107_0940 [Nostoc sp. PCC 7107]
MLNLSKVITLILISSSFCSASISTLSKPVLAGEPIIDKNCRRHQRTQAVFQKIPPQNQARIFMTSPFQINNQKYTLQLLKFPNSTGVLCFWKYNDRSPKRLNDIAIIQDKVIEKIEKHPSLTANYIVIVKGEKNEDILRTTYRLNLINPYQPKVTPIIRIYKN